MAAGTGAQGVQIFGLDRDGFEQGEALLLDDPNNPEELATHLQTVFADEALRKSLAEKGRQFAGNFTWEKTVEQTLAAFGE